MKTHEQIIERIRRHDDPLGFTTEAIIDFLPFAAAREFLEPDVTAEEWAELARPLTREAVIEQMRDYMEFAWGKVEGHRGISASRSVMKMTAWLWLIDDEALVENRDYPQYGAPILHAVCAKYGFGIPVSVEIANMVSGRPCRDDCGEGCGR
jgi:hypothetical protein